MLKVLEGLSLLILSHYGSAATDLFVCSYVCATVLLQGSVCWLELEIITALCTDRCLQLIPVSEFSFLLSSLIMTKLFCTSVHIVTHGNLKSHLSVVA